MSLSRTARTLVAASVAALACAGTASATVIVNESFPSGWTPGTTWVLNGTYTPAVVTVGGQTPATALRLTPATGSRTGTISYALPQPTTGGIDIRFKASQWGASGSPGDGLSFFLRKGSNSSNAPGADGGALGYAPIPISLKQGMPGGLLGVGLDTYGSFPTNVVDGSGCSGTSGTLLPNTIAVRGPGQALAGYCRLGVTSPGAVAFGGGTDSRSGRARSIRVTVDPSTTQNPRVKVYYGGDGSGTGLTQVLDVPVPAEILAEPTFKFGFSAATGGATNNNEIWDVQVDSLTDLPAVSITTTSLPGGTVGTAYACTAIATADGVAPMTFAVSSGSLPAGLTLDSATGEVCGTPTEEGTRTFTVSATDSRGPTPSTGTRQYSIAIADFAAPCTPGDLAATAVEEGAKLTWKPTTGAACGTPKTYEVEASTGEKCTVTAPALTCTIKGLQPGDTVRFRIRAINGVGASPWSAYGEPVEPTGSAVKSGGIAGTTADAVIVKVTTTRSGRITVVGASRSGGRWVTRCTGRRAVANATLNARVACALTLDAQGLLCRAPLRLRLTSTLVSTGRAPASNVRVIRVPKRNCANPAVVG